METVAKNPERVVEIIGLPENAEVFWISSKDNCIDFSTSEIMLTLYFNGELHYYKQTLQSAVEKQSDKTVYRVQVPRKATTATILLFTMNHREDLNLIEYGFSRMELLYPVANLLI